jgi:hypothetical protein
LTWLKTEVLDLAISQRSRREQHASRLDQRAFDSQLLCEQVVGLGLRRMDGCPDPATGLPTEDHVDIFGCPSR